MPRKRTIDIECPFCGQGYIGPAGIKPPAYCGYCNRAVREWIVEEENPEENPELYKDINDYLSYLLTFRYDEGKKFKDWVNKELRKKGYVDWGGRRYSLT